MGNTIELIYKYTRSAALTSYGIGHLFDGEGDAEKLLLAFGVMVIRVVALALAAAVDDVPILDVVAFEDMPRTQMEGRWGRQRNTGLASDILVVEEEEDGKGTGGEFDRNGIDGEAVDVLRLRGDARSEDAYWHDGENSLGIGFGVVEKDNTLRRRFGRVGGARDIDVLDGRLGTVGRFCVDAHYNCCCTENCYCLRRVKT